MSELLYGRYTSISAERNANYQIDYAGGLDVCITRFETACIKREAKWAHLFDEKNGQMVATFNNVQGITIISGGTHGTQ